MARYGVFAILFAVLIAGIGFSLVVERFRHPKIRVAFFLVCLAFVLLDFHADIPLTALQPEKIDLWLAAQPGSGAVVQFPIRESTTSAYVYSSLIHHKPLLGMFSGAYLPASFNQIMPTLLDFPNAESVSLLRTRGVQYVIVDSYEYPQLKGKWDTLVELGLQQAAQFGQYRVFVLTPE